MNACEKFAIFFDLIGNIMKIYIYSFNMVINNY